MSGVTSVTRARHLAGDAKEGVDAGDDFVEEAVFELHLKGVDERGQC